MGDPPPVEFPRQRLQTPVFCSEHWNICRAHSASRVGPGTRITRSVAMLFRSRSASICFGLRSLRLTSASIHSQLGLPVGILARLTELYSPATTPLTAFIARRVMEPSFVFPP